MENDLNWSEERIPEIYPNLFKLFESVHYLVGKKEIYIHLKKKDGKFLRQKPFIFALTKSENILKDIFNILEDLFENKEEEMMKILKRQNNIKQ